MMRPFFYLFLEASLASAYQIWKAPADIPSTVPAKCRAAMVANVTCDTIIQPYLAASGQFLVGNGAKSFCSSTCQTSLDNYKKSLTTNCGNTFYTLYYNTTTLQSAQAVAEGLQWANSLVCVQDQQGYCLPALDAGNKTDCSQCSLRYGALMVSSDYGRAKYPVNQFSSLLSSCSAPASSYPYTYTPLPTAGATTTVSTSTVKTTSVSATPTCAGTLYTVAASDTCKSISLAKSIAIDRMIDVNHLDRNCSSLVTGRSLCLVNPCPLATIQRNQTCTDLQKGRNFTIAELQSWNPVLRNMCNTKFRANLNALVDRTICIGPPGGENFVRPSTTAAPSSTFSPTMFTGSWTAGSTNNTVIPTVTIPEAFNYTKPFVTVTFERNNTQETLLADRRKYCWVTNQDMANNFDIEDYAPGCQALYTTYCDPDLSQPSPTSPSKIPAACTPTARF